jgi:hypothetical protein
MLLRDLSLHLVVIVLGYLEKLPAFGCAAGRNPNGYVSASGLPCLLVKKLGGLTISFEFRHVSDIV